MNFEDLKEQLKSDFAKTRDRLEESALFNSLKDKYQNLNALSQKLVVAGLVGLVALAILAIPYGNLETSGEHVAQFESHRSLIRDLLRVQKEINETPQIPIPPPLDQVRSQVDGKLQSAGLLPEQMKGVTTLPALQNDLVKANQNEGVVEARLGSLNVRQILDLGYEFQQISPSVKVKDLLVNATMGQPGYFDVVYRLLVLRVAPEELPPPEPPPKKGSRK